MTDTPNSPPGPQPDLNPTLPGASVEIGQGLFDPAAPVSAERDLPDAARRALAEAAERRAAAAEPDRPREILGRPGPEPVRYGDWENKGIASDF
jgi:hypothetical protein